uniref:Uncharacterized protein n=1 Tax=Lepeophtheirus salmonis TaxID=72036 RepID=A0A0K2U3V3_LEPSM
MCLSFFNSFVLHVNSYCIQSSYTYIIELKSNTKKNIMEKT